MFRTPPRGETEQMGWTAEAQKPQHDPCLEPHLGPSIANHTSHTCPVLMATGHSGSAVGVKGFRAIGKGCCDGATKCLWSQIRGARVLSSLLNLQSVHWLSDYKLWRCIQTH